MLTYTWIADSEAFDKFIISLENTTLLAVDTESDSLYSYFDKVCLVQLSTRSKNYIIDPLVVDINPLADIFANPKIEKIFHAAEYDVITLRRDYGFKFANLFDTMLAARVLGWPKIGLANILQSQFQVKLNKKYQQHNWGRRPLDERALQYACHDTYYLPQLRDLQLSALKANKRLAQAQNAFIGVTQARAKTKFFYPGDFRSIKQAKTLSRKEQAILQNLYVFRDELARRLDKPTFKVMNDMALMELLQSRPSTPEALRQIRGIHPRIHKHYSQQVLQKLQPPYPKLSPRIHKRQAQPSPLITQRYEALKTWRLGFAEKQGVDPDVILPNKILRRLAKSNPKRPSDFSRRRLLNAWQAETYGAAILNVLKAFR